MKQLISAFIIALCLSGCSDSSESQEELAETALRDQVANQSKGQIRVISFTKLNGETMKDMGVDVRRIYFEATLDFPSAGWWLSGNGYTERLNYEFVPGTQAINTTFTPGAVRVAAYGEIVVSGTLEGHKMDNGWQFSVGSSEIKPGQLKRVSQ